MESPIQNKPINNERENKETAPDFLKIFEERLASVEPLTDEDAKDLASWYNDAGITSLKREMPVILFNPNGIEFATLTDIWTENPDNLDMTSHYIHDQLIDKLHEFLSISKNILYVFAGYILEDSNGIRYLVLDETRANNVKNNMLGDDYRDKERGSQLLDLLNKYSISKIIETYSKEEVITEGDTTITKTRSASREVIGKNMLDKRREDVALINLARKYNMTNSQYLRLVTLAKVLFEDGKQVSLDEIAQSIVEDPDNENIPVKHLPLE